MGIFVVELSPHVQHLLSALFIDCLTEYFPNHKEQYLLHLLEALERKVTKEGLDGPLHQWFKSVAINAHNAIHYSMQLDSDRHPIDED